jgi:hypothetical protein
LGEKKMKLTLLKKTGFLYLLAILFVPCLAHATVLGTVDLIYSGPGASDAMTIWGGSAQGTTLNIGASKFQKLSGTGQGELWSNLDVIGAYSIDLYEPRAGYRTTYDVIMPSDGPRAVSYLGSTIGTTKEKYIQELWGRYYDPAWTTGDTFTSPQKTKAAVFAIALWEIVYEDFSGNPMDWNVMTDGTPGSGGFAADYMYASIANDWLHSLDGTGPRADLRVFSPDGYQDFLVAVPEPMTIILLTTGSLVMLKRKRGA